MTNNDKQHLCGNTFGRHYQIRHGLLLPTIIDMSNNGGAVSPSVGIYYVAKVFDQWTVLAYRYDDIRKELDHSEFWERHVIERIAGGAMVGDEEEGVDFDEAVSPAEWERRILQHQQERRPKEMAMRKALKNHPYGFPRGRVACVEGKYHVYHGLDLPKALGIKRQTIEAIFGIKGNAKWVADDHEHCLIADKEAIREILTLDDDWSAV